MGAGTVGRSLLAAYGAAFGLLFLIIAAVRHSEQLELPVQRRALHPNEARRPRDVAREAADLDLQIFALEGLSGFAQGGSHDRAGGLVRQEPGGLGRELGPDALEAFTETKNVFISTED